MHGQTKRSNAMYFEEDDGIVLIKPDTVADASLLVWLAEHYGTSPIRFELKTHTPVSVLEMGLEIRGKNESR